MSFDLARIQTLASAKGVSGGQLEVLHDLRTLGSSQTSTINLDGYACDDYDDAYGTVRIENGRHDGSNKVVDPAEFAASIQKAITKVANGGDPGEDLSKLLTYSLVATCQFRVPAGLGENIDVEGVVRLDGGTGAQPAELVGRTSLPVDLPKTPDKPAVQGPGKIVLHEGGSIRGTGPRGTVIRWNIDGKPYPTPTAYVGNTGEWELKLPPGVPADGKPRSFFVTSEAEGATAPSETGELTVLPALARPVVTDPKTGTVSPGQVLTVSGSEGSAVTPVGENGAQAGSSATVRNGTAQVTLNKDLPDGATIRIRATDAATAASDALFSDPKAVKSEPAPEPSQVEQVWKPYAAPGKAAGLTFVIQPQNGDLSSIAGKRMTIRAPDGFTFQRVSDTSSPAYGSFNITAAAGDKDDRNNKEWVGLANAVTVTPDGKTMTFAFPGADVIKRLVGDYSSIKIGVTVEATAEANATAGEKTGGQATVEGIGTTELKGNVL
ncbi:hypothetical protein CU254_28775 [Amycolatopsis sp. AA4]|nr:hypothetical protein CU254_28775 [Amycolatopsis sp. AA4]